MIPHEVHESNLQGLLEPIGALLADPLVSEVMINGPHAIFVERGGVIERTDARFESACGLLAALRGVAQYVGRSLSEAQPILEARLPDGSRVEALLAPAAADGPIASIRRFARTSLTLEGLVERGSMDEACASALRALMRSRCNILVAGGTGSGKTSLLGALAALIPVDQRVIVIEDSRELQLAHPHVVHLEAQPPDPHGQGEITVRELFRATLRLRPDRIVVGELRGAEALELVQAMTSGHGGCLSTVHAASPRDALGRLETLASMSDVQLPLWALRAQIGSAIHAIAQVHRGSDGARRVTHVTSVAYREDSYTLTDVYRHDSAYERSLPTRRAP